MGPANALRASFAQAGPQEVLRASDPTQPPVLQRFATASSQQNPPAHSSGRISSIDNLLERVGLSSAARTRCRVGCGIVLIIEELFRTIDTVAGDRSRYSARIFSVTGLPLPGVVSFLFISQ